MTLSTSELIAALMLCIVVVGGIITQWSWVKTKWAEMNIKITSIEQRMDNDKKANDILASDLKHTNEKIFEHLDQIKEITTEIRINCPKQKCD